MKKLLLIVVAVSAAWLVTKASAQTAQRAGITPTPTYMYDSFTSIVPSTGTCGYPSNPPSLVLNANSNALGTTFTNEGPYAVRIGSFTNITSTWGKIVYTSGTFTLDSLGFFRGPLYCINTVANSSSSWSVNQNAP